jgi:putative endonuclease
VGIFSLRKRHNFSRRKNLPLARLADFFSAKKSPAQQASAAFLRENIPTVFLLILMQNYAKKLGNWGERLAGRFLQKKGYRILEANYCIAGGQLDLIARSPLHQLVFVEIKTRTANSFVEDSLSWHQRLSLLKTARVWLHQNNLHCYWQFDLISIHLDRKGSIPQVKIKHLKNIFSE